MVLLSQLMRTAAITGRPDAIDASWFAGRQGGRWAEQTVRKAIPARGPAETLRELHDLHQRGVITDSELEQLRARTVSQPRRP
jgi:hypothetical protein